MDSLIVDLEKSGLTVRQNEPLNRHCTMRVGGPADAFIAPTSSEQIAKAIDVSKQHGAAYVVVGNGSNIVFRDGGYRGLVIALGDAFSQISVLNGGVITSQAGAMLSRLSYVAMENSLTGLEFAHGIPASVGGAVAMNAGAYSGEIKNALETASVLSNGEIKTLTRDELRMGYRSTRVLSEDMIVLEARFALLPGDARAISEKMNDLDERRRLKQPLNYPSSGSTFKRPVGYFAGELIEKAGLKGERAGGAMVSEKHAGFIVNYSNATAKDVLTLIERVKLRVYENLGVKLEEEVRVIGED